MSATVALPPVTSSAAIAAPSSPVTCSSATPNVPASAATRSVGHWSFRRVRITPRPPSTSMYAEISSADERAASRTMRPSARKRMRSAWPAATGSCVTIAIDWP